jgi:AbiV family abortive infection protein
MKPRSFKSLMQTPKSQRLAVIAEGLKKLAEHVGSLEQTVQRLDAAGDHRGAAVVAVTVDEEAAKFLMLLDFVRMGDAPQKILTTQLSAIADHHARCLYSYLTNMSPATFGELRGLANHARQSLYLDGPDEIDWIFRNYLIARREDALYVDYVETDEGLQWTSPSDYSVHFASGTSNAVPLVRRLASAGLDTVEALRIVADTWDGIVIEDNTKWVEILRRNNEVLRALVDHRLPSFSFSEQDAAMIADRWTYPLTSLDLSEEKVSRADLEARRESLRGR